MHLLNHRVHATLILPGIKPCTPQGVHSDLHLALAVEDKKYFPTSLPN